MIALDSFYALFPVTREILRRRGRGAIAFSKVAIPVLNQVVRPFTARWHREFWRERLMTLINGWSFAKR